MDIHFIYITVGNMEEARKIGRALVENRQVACVNLLENMQSMYWWEGKIQEDKEVVLIAKTTRTLVSQVIETVRALHSYACPCIVSLPVSDGYPGFLDWIKTEVK